MSAERRERARKPTTNAEAKRRNCLKNNSLSTEADMFACGARPEEDELAVIYGFLHGLVALSGGQLHRFRPLPPSPELRGLLRRASTRELQGTLIEILTLLRSPTGGR